MFIIMIMLFSTRFLFLVMFCRPRLNCCVLICVIVRTSHVSDYDDIFLEGVGTDNQSGTNSETDMTTVETFPNNVNEVYVRPLRNRGINLLCNIYLRRVTRTKNCDSKENTLFIYKFMIYFSSCCLCCCYCCLCCGFVICL